MSTIQPVATQPRAATIVLTIFLVIAAIFGNSFGTFLFVDSGLNSDLSNAILSFLIGALVAQPCLLALWATLSSQKLTHRVMFSCGVLALVTTLYLVVLTLFDNRIEVIVPLILTGISFGTYFLAMIPNMVFRWKSRHAFSSQAIATETNDAVQFGIRHILILMTAVAVLVPIAQRVFQSVRLQGSEPWLEISVFIALYAALIWGAFLLTIACVFANRPIFYFVSTTFYLAFAPVGVAVLMSVYFVSFQPLDTENCIYGICFATGFSLTMIAVLRMYFSIGYRLRPIAGN